MQNLSQPSSGRMFGNWIGALGFSCKLLFCSLAMSCSLRKDDFLYHFRWMGLGGLPLIALCAIFISCALCVQTVVELQKFGAEDLAGTVITVGLLRELGALTVSAFWGARTASVIAQQARGHSQAGNDVDPGFFLPRYLAAITAGGLLCAYGLVIGLLAAAFAAPFLGVSSSFDFMEAARSVVQNKDVAVYLVKLHLVAPTVAVLAGCVAGNSRTKTPAAIADRAVTYTCCITALCNLVITLAVYIP